jgi:hypothetical protein
MFTETFLFTQSPEVQRQLSCSKHSPPVQTQPSWSDSHLVQTQPPIRAQPSSCSEIAFLFKDRSCPGRYPCSGTTFLFILFRHSLPAYRSILFRHSPLLGTTFLFYHFLFRHRHPVQTSILFRQILCSGKTLLFRHSSLFRVPCSETALAFT